MYQTAYQTNNLVSFRLNLPQRHVAPTSGHVAPTSGPVAGSWPGLRMVGLDAKARDKANVGLTWGLEYVTPFQSSAPCGTMKGCRAEVIILE